jgi:hypothetical protein
MPPNFLQREGNDTWLEQSSERRDQGSLTKRLSTYQRALYLRTRPSRAISATSGKKKQADVENAVRGQTILNPEQAKEWGIVTDIRDTFMEPGAVFVSVNTPVPLEEKKPVSPYTTLKQPISSGAVSQ